MLAGPAPREKCLPTDRDRDYLPTPPTQPRAFSVFQGWDSFFQITGEAAATLVGLLFLVVSFSESRDRTQLLRAVSIYLTPSALHFAIVLTISALAVAPQLPVSVRVGFIGLAALTGLGNAIWACIGMALRARETAPAHWSDFWMYGVAPATIYSGLAATAAALWFHVDWAAQAMAVFLLALLLLGVRNAWDLVTWMAPQRGSGSGNGRAAGESGDIYRGGDDATG